MGCFANLDTMRKTNNYSAAKESSCYSISLRLCGKVDNARTCGILRPGFPPPKMRESPTTRGRVQPPISTSRLQDSSAEPQGCAYNDGPFQTSLLILNKLLCLCGRLTSRSL